MVASFEVQGLWWLPEHEDHKVPGVLSWDSDRGGTLRLVGQLWPVVLLDNALPGGGVQKYRDPSRDDDRSYPVVLGEVEGKEYTLLNAFQTSKRDWSLEQSTEAVHANAVLEDAWFDGPEVEVDQVIFRMRDLAAWVDVTGLDAEYPRMERAGEEYVVITARPVPDIVVPSSGPNVVIGHRLEVKSQGIETMGVDQDWVLRLKQDEVAPLQSFVEVASDLQDLVSIATGRTAEFRRLVLHHPELPARSLAGTPIGKARKDLPYHAQWSNRVDYDIEGDAAAKSLSVFAMYFSFAHLGADGVGRWLDTAARFRTELGRAMATRYGRGYLEDRIMNVSAALESFDKHHRGTGKTKVDYVKRIEACVDVAGAEFRDMIVEDAADWANRVKDLRHDLAHHRDRFRLDGRSVGT